jgi:hypothetical protein
MAFGGLVRLSTIASVVWSTSRVGSHPMKNVSARAQVRANFNWKLEQTKNPSVN